jgi:hypothetical protein
MSSLKLYDKPVRYLLQTVNAKWIWGKMDIITQLQSVETMILAENIAE